MQLIQTFLRTAITSLFAATFCWAEDSNDVINSEVTLVVTVVNLSDEPGPVQIAIDTEETWFVKDVEPIRSFTVQQDDEQAILLIDDIEPGVYALRVYHDEDDDGELDTNFFGIPKEPYGFSGKRTDRMRPRSFDYAKFTIDAPMKMTIKLR